MKALGINEEMAMDSKTRIAKLRFVEFNQHGIKGIEEESKTTSYTLSLIIKYAF